MERVTTGAPFGPPVRATVIDADGSATEGCQLRAGDLCLSITREEWPELRASIDRAMAPPDPLAAHQ
jgi:hypothetical protein